MGGEGEEGRRLPSHPLPGSSCRAASFALFVCLERIHDGGCLFLRASSKDPTKWVTSFLSFIRSQIWKAFGIQGPGPRLCSLPGMPCSHAALCGPAAHLGIQD